ncbi:MAG: response regulator [Bacteroidales bacterium]|nr:response regulator [Bacteroidales bacterium]
MNKKKEYKVLVIDDSEVNLFLIKSIFEDQTDIKISIENNSRKAMKNIKEKQPDLILLDLMMPHVDGYQILEELNEDEKLKSIPVIVISAKSDRDSVAKAFEYNIVDYIKKPIVLPDIENKIRMALQKNE